MYWPAAENKSHTTAKIYDSLFVRHWDAWITENQNSLWYSQLEKNDGKWTVEGSFTNLLQETSLVCPVPPFGGAGDFDLSETGIAFVSKDPEINLARYTKSDLYYVPLKSYAEAPGKPQIVRTGELVGYCASPTFSRDGKKLAFLRMKSKQYESDKNRLLLIHDINDLNHVQEFYKTEDGKGGWDRKPDSILWSHDDKNFFTATEHHGRVVLWTLPASPAEAKELPKPVLEDGHVSDAYVLGNSSRLFITSTSRIESSKYSVLDLETKDLTEVSSSSKNGKSFGLHKDQMFDIWYQGSRGYENHAICMTPSDFDKSKKYPLAFLIHGGPQNAWADDWSTRWNPAIFAEQGYVVVCPNPTGSTGYGQEHVDAIAENWGGSPYEDLVKCFEYVEKNLSFVDIERSVALGASYGGYMISKYFK
jgi:dipeptidyl aminopeptidase/acylaminoacyl peptidase